MVTNLLPYRWKQPDEVRTLTFDFARKLVSGATLTGTPTVVAQTGLTVGAGTIAGSTVSAQVSGGTLGSEYKVTCRCGVSNGDVLELDVMIRVAEEN